MNGSLHIYYKCTILFIHQSISCEARNSYDEISQQLIISLQKCLSYLPTAFLQLQFFFQTKDPFELIDLACRK